MSVESIRFSCLVPQWSFIIVMSGVLFLLGEVSRGCVFRCVVSPSYHSHYKNSCSFDVKNNCSFVSFPSCHLSTSSGQFTDDDAPPIPWSVECDEQIVFTKGLLCSSTSSSNMLFSSLFVEFYSKVGIVFVN